MKSHPSPHADKNNARVASQQLEVGSAQGIEREGERLTLDFLLLSKINPCDIAVRDVLTKTDLNRIGSTRPWCVYPH